ncbi:alpha-2-macroglobulin-like [Scyliorhinus canicula]|uniref:alpha-2-macroglobulin-like n=1 Tax=Scyliorhinus canicula TaxID=7830 RepID=UPI0018F614B4|nr:alpha-2-macroglobulin-like [Scyliorhinus canicula]
MQAWGILACLMLTAVRARSHYVVLIPAELRTDTLENVCVLILSATESSPLTLTIENEMTNSTLLQQELLTNTGYNCFNFTIEEKELSTNYVVFLAVTVRGSGGNISINETKKVVLKRYDSLTFIQTDKAVYKPGQTVKFRIVTLNEDFIPIQEKYPLVTVWDPESNRIRRWRDVEPRQGIADLTFDLLLEPTHGTYRIEVLKNRGKRDHDFSVQEYVLPNAELKVKMPQKIKITDPTIHIEVCGRYTYGKPVKGLVNGTICLESHNYVSRLKHCQHVNGQTDSDGCLIQVLPLKAFKLIERRFNLNIHAHFVLTEDGTGIQISSFAQSEVITEITKITFEEVESYYKSGFEYKGQIQMQYSTGGPVSNATIHLFTSLKPGAEKVSTDENGIASFSLDTSSWGSLPVSFTAIYQGQYQDYEYQNSLPHHQPAHHLVKPFYSRSNSYLSIRKHHHALACDSETGILEVGCLSGKVGEKTAKFEEHLLLGKCWNLLFRDSGRGRQNGTEAQSKNQYIEFYYREKGANVNHEVESVKMVSQAVKKHVSEGSYFVHAHSNPGHAHFKRKWETEENESAHARMCLMHQRDDIMTCYRCGNAHLKGKCPAQGKQCLKCGKFNHYASQCRSSAKFQTPKPKQRHFNVRCVDSSEQKKNKENFSSEKNNFSLENTFYIGIEKSYNKHSSTIKNKKVKKMLRFEIVENERSSLLGTQACKDFQLVQRIYMNTQDTLLMEDEIQHILQQYPDVFKEIFHRIMEQMTDGVDVVRDIIIWSTRKEEHICRWKNIFQRIHKFGLKLNQAKCTFAQSSLNFLGDAIFSQGVRPDNTKISAIQNMKMPEGTKGHFHLSLPINADLSPVARLLVFTILPDGETIGDSAKFQVSKCFRNKFCVSPFLSAEDLPKSHVSLDVHAAPDSLCGLRVVDRSVLLLKPEMEFSRDSVYSLLPVLDLSGYHYRIQEGPQEFCRRQGRWLEPVSMNDAIGDFALLLQDMGLKILTNTEYHRPIECEMSEDIIVSLTVTRERSFGERRVHTFFGHPGAMGPMRRQNAAPRGRITETAIRKYFPETWIWDLVPVGPTGSASLPLTVPDSITEWKGSMFCTGQAGFGISETVSLNAFKPFFVELALPYSIVRTEEFTLKAKVFNYLKKCIMVKVTLLEHKGFDMASESSIEHQTCVCSMESVTISWHLNATGLGEQNLTVKAESIPSDSLCGNEVVIVPEKGAIDIIRKPLLIKPEGTETELTHSSLLCPAGKSVTEKIHLQLPEDAVEGSSRAHITVLGDIMGSAMENLDSLISLPTGCGEQSMVDFAPNVYVQRYLNKTHQLTREIQDRAVDYLQRGYQNQLKYKHSDGSFSIFGDSDSEGNTWLTAFVLKSFVQARPYIFIEENILKKATTFFLKNRMESGCFASLGGLFNNAMKGGVDDHISLSAYVTSALLELGKNDKELADNAYTQWQKKMMRSLSTGEYWSSSDSEEAAERSTASPNNRTATDFQTGVTDRALSCLRDALETVNSTYTLSLLAYTFTLAGDQATRSKILNRLEGLAVKKDGLTHWQRKEDPEEEEDFGYWWRAPSAEVEMTAYVLLALLSQPQVPASDLDQAIHIVSWLVKQRNSYGGFASTQDTVVALQALALYAELTHVADPHGSVSVTSESGFHKEFHIDSTNQLLLQSQPLTEIPGDYTAEISGTSCLLIQTTLRYNTPTAQKDTVFNLSVDMVIEESKHKININITYIGDRPVSNMVLADVSMLSGFSAVKNSYQQSLDHLNISRAEIHDDHTVLYLKPMEPNHLLQLSILVHQDFEIENLKAAVLKVYDYYETDDFAEVEYEAPRGSENM